MTKSFDDWYDEESPFKGNENNEDCKWASKFMQQAYEAGKQSKQAEIDELQKRIELALEHTTNHGGYDDLTHIINILKGVTS